MFMYVIYKEVKAVYTLIKVKKEINKIVEDLHNLNWDEIIDQVNNNLDNVVCEQ